MMTGQKIHWANVELRDGDDHPVTGKQRDRALDQYRRKGEMSGAFFVNPETGESGDWDYAPAIDWSGYDDPTADGVYAGSKAHREVQSIAGQQTTANVNAKPLDEPERTGKSDAPTSTVRRARPAKPQELIRDINLIVKVTAKEKAEIEQRAAEAGFLRGKVGDFVRRRLLGDD